VDWYIGLKFPNNKLTVYIDSHTNTPLIFRSYDIEGEHRLRAFKNRVLWRGMK
jgi:hypothetical protein